MQFGLRLILNGELPQVGATLPNSWHPASECDWLEEDQELPGSCCFLMADDTEEAEAQAWMWASSYWPDCTDAVIISGRLVREDRYGGLPEEGAGVIAEAVAVRHANRQ